MTETGRTDFELIYVCLVFVLFSLISNLNMITHFTSNITEQNITVEVQIQKLTKAIQT